jgi:hypothetical protein
MRTLFYATTYWTPALLILLIVIARMAAPFPYGGTDYDRAIEESLIAAAKQRSDSGYVYVKVDGSDPSTDILSDLNSHKLTATFAPWSLRPHSQCPPNHICGGTVGPELLDNFLSADLLSVPLWRLALVRIRTGSCSAELTLFRATQWHVLSQRTACTGLAGPKALF